MLIDSVEIAAAHYRALNHESVTLREKSNIARGLCQRVLREDCNNAICADALRNLLVLHGLADHIPEWQELVLLADRVDLKVIDQGDIRKLRAQATVVAIWSLERFEHYKWGTKNYRLLEMLAEAAKALPWDDFIDSMNRILVTRHERALHNNRAKKIDSDGILKTDMTVMLGNKQQNLVQQDHIMLWVERRYNDLFVDGVKVADYGNERLHHWHIRFDGFGLLEPFRDPSTHMPLAVTRESRGCALASNKPASIGTNAPGAAGMGQKRKGSKLQKLEGRSYPGSMSNATSRNRHNTRTSCQREDAQEASPLLEAFSPSGLQTSPVEPETDPIGLELREGHCAVCQGSCHVATVGRGWPLATQSAMYSAAHRAVRLSGETASSVPQSLIQHLRFASCCVDPCEKADSLPDLEAEVLLLSSEFFHHYQMNGHKFEQPVLIREAFADADDYDPPAFWALLRDAFTGMKADIQPCQEQEAASLDIDALIAGFQEGQSLNALSLPNLTRAIEPQFVRSRRFSLLRELVQRTIARYQNTTSKQVRYYDVGSCEGFNIIGGPGAFSGPHMDSLNGTWLRNLFGNKVWFIVPEREMREEDWLQFARDGVGWDPKTKARAILIQEGDVLFMPPGASVIHAVLTLDTCLMQGGMVWDRESMCKVLTNIHWMCLNQNSTNEAIPFQLSAVLDEMEELVKHGRLDHSTKLETAIADLRALGCCCGKRCTRKECTCFAQRRRCTPLCRAHPTGQIERHCMQEHF